MESKTPTELSEKMPPAAILLAAGSASRMGSPKQLLELRGMTLLEIALRKAREAGYAPLLVVGGAYREPLEKLCAEVMPEVHFCHNPDWATGMGSSISCGLRHLLEIAPKSPGALIFLADQPAVRAGQMEEMRLMWESEHPPYVAAYYREKPGAPALFSRSLFPELLQLTGAEGAKSLFARFLGIRYALPEAAIDLDTPEEWAKFVAENSA